LSNPEIKDIHAVIETTDITEPQDQEFSRRDALKGAAFAGAFLTLAAYSQGALGLLERAGGDDVSEHESCPPIDGTSSQGSNPEKGEETLANGHTKEDIYSAGFVGAAFSIALGRNIAGSPFDAKSATAVIAAEGLRLAYLGVSGNVDAVKHDVKELSTGLVGIPLLVGLAETSQHAQADEESLFQNLNTLLKEFDRSNIILEPEYRSGNEADIRSYIHKLRERQDQIVHQNAAVGFMVAPFTSTYTSSALCDEQVGRMAEVTYRVKKAEATT
jgi:hypothetical protein